MTQDELLSALKQQLQQCAGCEGDEIAKAREKALDYYFQRPRGDELAGRSHVVSGDLSAMTEATLAQMLDSFTTDNIVEFEPRGEEDEDQTQLESDTVHHFVMKRCNGFVELGQAIKGALLMRTGFMCVRVDERKYARTETFENAEPEALVQLQARPNVVSCKVQGYNAEKRTLTVRCVYRERYFKSYAVPAERLLLLKGWHTHDLQDIPFCAEWDITSRSELVALGVSKAKAAKLKRYAGGKSPTSDARNPLKLQPDRKAIDDSQDPILWYRAYVLIDRDGDGIAERREIWFNDDELLRDEPANTVPYAAGSAIINPHRLEGVSLFDKLQQTQDEHTGLKRMRLDGLNTAIKNRLAYLDGKVNVDDVSDGRPNGAIRVKSNVADIRTAVMPFQVPDTSGNIQGNIEALKSERTELGGAALELASGQLQIGGERMGSQGLDRAYSVVEQLSAMMTKNIAATLIRSTFLLAHATLRENFREPVPIKRNGKWDSPIPSKWPERKELTVKVGMSPGERARRVAALDSILDRQVKLAELGMDEVLVNLDGFYKVMMDRDRAADVQHPEQYYVDPQSDAAKEAMQTKQTQAKQQAEMRQQLMTQAVTLERFGKMLEKYRTDQETQYKYWKGVLDAEVKEAEIVGRATTDLLKAKELPSERPAAPEGGEGSDQKPAARGNSRAAAA